MEIELEYLVTIEFTIGQVCDRDEELDEVWIRVLKYIEETGKEVREFSDQIQHDQDMFFQFRCSTKENAVKHGKVIAGILKEHEFNVG